MTSPQNVVGYCRVSTVEQAESGTSLEAQEAQLRAEAERRGWTIDIVVDEGKSAKDLDRPALAQALDALDEGAYSALMSVRLDRISRSVVDFSTLTRRAQGSGWHIVLLSPALDTSDPAGAFTTQILVAAAEYERALIGARTKEAMAHKKAMGGQVGRPRGVSVDTETRIRQERATGYSLRAIAGRLNADDVPTGGGGRWYASTVKAILERDAPPAESVGTQEARSVL